MKNCNGKTKHTCGDKSYATCVYYEKQIPEFSDLREEECITIEETTEDVYSILGQMKDELLLSELGQLCLTYVSGSEVNSIKKVLLKYEQEICLLKEKVEELETEAICNKNIESCLNLTGVVDQCDEPIKTLGQLLQYLINQNQV